MVGKGQGPRVGGACVGGMHTSPGGGAEAAVGSVMGQQGNGYLPSMSLF